MHKTLTRLIGKPKRGHSKVKRKSPVTGSAVSISKRKKVNRKPRDRSARRVTGLVRQVQGLQRELSNLRRVERSLRKTEERLTLASMGNGQGIWDVNLTTEEIYLSPWFEQMLGLEGLTSVSAIKKLLHPDDLQLTQERIQEHWEHKTSICELDCRVRNKEGVYNWLRIRASTLWKKGSGAHRMVGSVSDISRERELMEQIRQAQKMEAVGQFAGGIAHDFNNIIGVVQGYTDLLLRKMGREDPSRSKLEAIRSAGMRAAEMTRQLLAFGRRQLSQPKVVDVGDQLLQAGKMVRCLLMENVELVHKMEAVDARIRIDPNSLEQIVVNFIVNARDAMPTGGVLTLRTRNDWLSEDRAVSMNVSAGPYIVLEVMDTGTGMDETTRARIFEPFFTTKPTGQGTGLGLATVYGIVKQNGGFIEVESAPGKGSCFKVGFPQSKQLVDSVQNDLHQQEPPRGDETILVVEDEDWLRGLAYEILTRQGYRVFEVRNGDEALQLCSNTNLKIDLIFTDVVMPKQDGVHLRDHLSALRPDIRFLFTSGYPSKHEALDLGLAKLCHFITKPYDLLSLSRKVREVLDSEWK